MTRNPGVLLLAAFALGLLWEKRGKIARADLPALWLLLIPCGLLTVMAVLYHKVGDPLAFIHAHDAWLRKPTLPHQMYVTHLLPRLLRRLSPGPSRDVIGECRP